MVFRFPTDDALHFALTGGLVPTAISLAPARIGRDRNGEAWIATAAAVPSALPIVLRRVGIEIASAEPADGCEVAHWLEALPLVRERVPPTLTDQTPVLFELTDHAGLAALVGEILRLGNDRQSYRLPSDAAPSTQQPAFLKVIGPPYYSLLRAVDRDGPDAPRAYLERAPRVWVEVGWTHALMGQIKPPEGQIVLLRPPADWQALADGPFTDVYDSMDFQLPARPVIWTDSPAAEIRVPLRLVPGDASEPAEMWVLRGAAIDQIDEVVRNADEQLLSRLSFAVADYRGERMAIIRTRPGKTALPGLALEHAKHYRPYLRLPNLYLPTGQRLGPPLRRETVRRLLADDLDRVVWLTAREGESFVPHSLAETAFRPLADWVDYVMEQDLAALTSWIDAARFDFDEFVGPEAPILALRQRERKPRGATAAVAEAAKARIAPAKAEVTPPPAPEPFSAPTPATPNDVQIQLKAMEEQFLAVEGPLDDLQRLVLWPKLARLNVLLPHGADAALAWVNAIWESTAPSPAWTWSWVEAEQALAKPELTNADLDRLMSNPQPIASNLRPLAAAIIWASGEKSAAEALNRRSLDVQTYLEKHDHLLPVRMAWLAWHGLARRHAPGGSPGDSCDVLLLTRVRDRLLERLFAEGLGAERDLPGFLRFAGVREADRLRTIREGAERLRQLAHSWSGFPTGDGLEQTAAYIDLLFAFGFARLGNIGAAQSLMHSAGAALAASGNEAHTFLLEAFRYRIDQAIAGKPHAGPLPLEQLEYLDQMQREAEGRRNDEPTACPPHYAIERMKKESRVLDPQEEFEPYRRQTPEQDALVRDVLKLIDIHDRSRLAQGVRRVTADAAKNPRMVETRLRVLAESLSLANRIGEDLTVELLAQVAPALEAVGPRPEARVVDRQAILLERALLFAAHYDLPDRVRLFSDRLGDLLKSPAGRSATDALGRLVGQTLRSLRKLGLKDRIEVLLHQISDAILEGHSLESAQARAGHNWQSTLRLLLQLAAGWLYFDRPEEARPILDAARAWIRSPDKKPSERPALQYVPLVCAYITAAGQAPQDEALGRIEELFAPGALDRLPNTFTTRKYYSRLHLSIVEAVVFTLASDDFAIGPAARRWLDDDEYLVRRRIHRDVRAALTQM